MLINKEKISNVMIFDKNGKRVITTSSIAFPRDFFKIKGQELVMIKQSHLPYIPKDEPITAIFEYINGTRIRFETKVDISTDMQMNFHVGTGEVLEERRRSFKINVEFSGECLSVTKKDNEGNDVTEEFEKPMNIRFLNLNLGGALLKFEKPLEIGDVLKLRFLGGEMVLDALVLRAQINAEGELVGYGCSFPDISSAQEERIAKFIMDCQFAEIERKRRS